MMNDQDYMQLAVELATKGLYTTAPNPRVGCVIVKQGQIIGQGYHIKAGEPHAEIYALREAGGDANGATAYVTLEPCSHFGRTPPCSSALIEANVARVVIGMTDPNPKVSGRGIRMLEGAGIHVDVGVLEAPCRALNPGFIKRMTTGKPFVRLKLACSLDGKTAMASGESKWITSELARADVQHYRAQSCAILTGSGTVIADQPALTVRPEQLSAQYPLDKIRQPVRLVIDSQHQVKQDNLFFDHQTPFALINNQARSDFDESEQITLSGEGNNVDLSVLLDVLGERQINEVWLECGAKLAGVFLGQSLVDELILYKAPILMGEQSKGLVDIPNLTQLNQASRWQYNQVETIGPDLKLVLKAE